MTEEFTVKTTPKIVVIGGGSGQPVILRGLKKFDADLTAVITVADDGGSSGTLRDYLNIVPPGDIRNVMATLSTLPQEIIDIFQYRFHENDEMLANHALGNLIIAAMAEKEHDIFAGVQLLTKFMGIQGHVYPVANEPLILHAKFKDGTELSGEAEITAAHKQIDHIWVTPQPDSVNEVAQAPSEVINAILNDALGKSSLAGITLKIDVFVSPQLALSPLVLSVILGNTLDNAIRACSGVSADTPKIVSLTLRQKDSILYYRISNPYDPEFSSKKREGIHGYGLKNVSSTVEQIGGTMQINQENNQYTVEIILNL